MESNYILGSHNSWSYLNPDKWYLWPFKFIAKCQKLDIKEQYLLGVRCFDLRLCFDKEGKTCVAHGIIKYKITFNELLLQLSWLNTKGDCCIRVLHEVRTKKANTEESKKLFSDLCRSLVSTFPHLKFWCGKNLYTWDNDYDFEYNPSCEENYSSVKPPYLLDDWFPWIYATYHNKEIYEKGTDKDILLIDFVNIK